MESTYTGGGDARFFKKINENSKGIMVMECQCFGNVGAIMKRAEAEMVECQNAFFFTWRC